MNPKFKSGFVAIVGRPNAGKSTLVNSLLGEKIAAVTPKAQTTRKNLRAIVNREDAQLIFVDTPGIHVPPEGMKLNEAIVAEATDAITEVDAIIYILDRSRELPAASDISDENMIVSVLSRVKKEKNTPIVIFANKTDLPQKADQSRIEEIYSEIGADVLISGSAAEDKSAASLLQLVVDYLPEHPPYFDTETITDKSVREIVGELISEQLFLHLGEEIPYECAVEIEAYKEPKKGQKRTEIDAIVHVGRKSLKGMVIGKGARKIKEISKAARESVENFLGEKVILRLRVKESLGWTKDQRQLERLGLARK